MTYKLIDGEVIPPSNLSQATSSTGGIIILTHDLGGTYSSPSVVQINGASVPASGSLAIGNTLRVSGASALSYGALNLAGGSNYVSGLLPAANQANQSLVGDLSGNTGAATVTKVNSATVPAAGSLTIGNVLQVSGSSALTYAPINLGGGSNYVTGTLPSGNQAAQSLSGDLSGTTASATVIALQGNAIQSGTNGAAQDGYVITWVNSANQYQVKPSSGSGGGSPTGAAGGDLSSTYPNPTVAKIQGVSVTSSGTYHDGYILTYSTGTTNWVPKPPQLVEFNIFSGVQSLVGTGSNTYSTLGTTSITNTNLSGQATFEVIVYASAGITVQTTLYNLTLGSTVSGSTQTFTGTSPGLVQASITLASGTNIYEAQFKNTNSSPASTDTVICVYAAIRMIVS